MTNHKKVIKNQKYEDYWKLTLGTSNIYGNQFIRTLEMIVNHIDKYDLGNKSKKELISGKRLNQEVTHSAELEKRIKEIYLNDDKSGASTRKQINQYIKLGFIKPYFQGYSASAKEYIKPGQTQETLQRLFSDTLYQYASFNSSRTKKDKFNQIKFLVQTILNRTSKKIDMPELIGLINDSRILNQTYAREKDLATDKKWAQNIKFEERKYNQVRYICNVLNKMSLFRVVDKKKDTIITLQEHAKDYFPEPGNSKRDTYRFSLMKKAVFDESIKVYGKKQCWFTKEVSMGLTVSHLYASAEALRNYDNDAAYDPQNALLLLPGNPDQYVDHYIMTFNDKGEPIFANNADPEFVKKVKQAHYKIDKNILTPERKKYLKIHNKKFEEKNHIKI